MWRETKGSVLALALVAGLFSATCKEGDPVGGTIGPAVPEFSPDPPSGSDHRVGLEPGSVDGGRIVLDVVVTDVDEPIDGVSIQLTYPASFSRFVSCSDGTLFPPGTCYFSESAPGSGDVLVSRNAGPGETTPAIGARVAMRLEFLVFGLGSGPITIEGQNIGELSAVLGADGEPIFVEWVAGTLSGR